MAARLKITPEILAEARRLADPAGAGLPVREIADQLRVGKSQLAAALGGKPKRARKTQATRRTPSRAAGKPAPARRATRATASVTGQPVAPGSPPVATAPADPLEVVRRILAARNGAALQELEDGLAVYAAGGDGALVPWLARPIVAPTEIDADPLVSLVEGLALTVGVVRTAPNGAAKLRAITVLEKLGNRVSQILADRPKIETEDEREARSREDADAVLRRIRATLPELLATRGAP